MHICPSGPSSPSKKKRQKTNVIKISANKMFGPLGLLGPFYKNFKFILTVEEWQSKIFNYFFGEVI